MFDVGPDDHQQQKRQQAEADGLQRQAEPGDHRDRQRAHQDLDEDIADRNRRAARPAPPAKEEKAQDRQ